METNEYSIYIWGIMIIICSFIGFVIENIWIALRCGYMDNRNMNLPFLLGYGIAVFAIYHLLGTPKKSPDIRYFIGTFIFVSLGEMILGQLVEKICEIHYWDYSTLPLHFTRYTDVFTSAGFAFLITKFMRNAFPLIINWIQSIDSEAISALSIFGMVLLIADYLASFGYMYRHKSFYNKWKHDFNLNLESLFLR